MVRTIAKSTTVLFVIAAFCSAAAARGVDDCPSLPENSGFEWHYRWGPDFDLCHAKPTNSDSGFFGMYLGYAPGLFPAGTEPSHSGRIGGVAVTWSSMKSDDAQAPQAFQTIFAADPADPFGTKVHVWIVAKSRDELEQIEALLQAMKVEPTF